MAVIFGDWLCFFDWHILIDGAKRLNVMANYLSYHLFHYRYFNVNEVLDILEDSNDFF